MVPNCIVCNIMVWFLSIIPSLVFKIEYKILGTVSLLRKGGGTCSFQAEERGCSQALELATFHLTVSRLLSETVCCLSMVRPGAH